jgi:CheY-like chemotaxis protein
MQHELSASVDSALPAGNNQCIELLDLPRPGGPGVLVVDDDPLVRTMVQLALKQNGFEVWLAPNGREAILLYLKEQESIAVVLLDVRMPGLDGPTTLEALRALNPDVRACFMSGEFANYEPEELMQRGAYLISKPFDLDHLANTLGLLVHGVPLISSSREEPAPVAAIECPIRRNREAAR